MNWANVKLILLREVRDQLRDRRTLFMIAVLPILLYPLLGMSFFQVMQFLREHPIRVLIVGAPESPGLPKLVEGDRFAKDLFPVAERAALMQVTVQSPEETERLAGVEPLEQARRDMQDGNFEVVVYFPPNFAQRYQEFHESLGHDDSAAAAVKVPQVEVYPNLANDASQPPQRRVPDALAPRCG